MRRMVRALAGAAALAALAVRAEDGAEGYDRTIHRVESLQAGREAALGVAIQF